jgi:hypothetical protein
MPSRGITSTLSDATILGANLNVNPSISFGGSPLTIDGQTNLSFVDFHNLAVNIVTLGGGNLNFRQSFSQNDGVINWTGNLDLTLNASRFVNVGQFNVNQQGVINSVGFIMKHEWTRPPE